MFHYSEFEALQYTTQLLSKYAPYIFLCFLEFKHFMPD